MGTTLLSWSTKYCAASKAGARCGALTASTMLVSPTSTRPTRCATATDPISQRAFISSMISAIFRSAIGWYASYSRRSTRRPSL